MSSWQTTYFFLFLTLLLNFIMINILSLILFNYTVIRSNLLICSIVKAICYLNHLRFCYVKCIVSLQKFLPSSFIKLDMLTKLSKSSISSISQHFPHFFNSQIMKLSRFWGAGSKAKVNDLSERSLDINIKWINDILYYRALAQS